VVAVLFYYFIFLNNNCKSYLLWLLVICECLFPVWTFDSGDKVVPLKLSYLGSLN